MDIDKIKGFQTITQHERTVCFAFEKSSDAFDFYCKLIEKPKTLKQEAVKHK